MKIIIDSDVCFKYEGCLDNIFLLLSIYFGHNINNDTVKDLKFKGFLCDAEEGDVEITSSGISFVETILVESEFKSSTKNNFDDLAIKLRELFPEGKKRGTHYMWRDSANVISKRLKLFMKKFDVKCSDADIIKATKKYVEGFSKAGDYTYMQLLKYFIFKDDTSQLLSYIENLNSEDTEDQEWVTNLK